MVRVVLDELLRVLVGVAGLSFVASASLQRGL
jgi:hypothetical protein